MKSGTAADENNAIHRAKVGVRHVQSTEFSRGLLKAKTTAQSVSHAVRLLVDFLEHVVRIVTLIDGIGGIFDLTNLVVGAVAGDGRDLESFGLQGDDLVVVEINHVPCVSHNGAHITGEKVFIFSNAQNERASAAGADDDAWDVGMNDRDTVGADDLTEGLANGLDEGGLGP